MLQRLALPQRSPYPLIGALHMNGAGAHSRQRVRHRHLAIVVCVDAKLCMRERDRCALAAQSRQSPRALTRRLYRKAQSHQRRRQTAAASVSKAVFHIQLGAIEEMLGIVNDFFALRL